MLSLFSVSVAFAFEKTNMHRVESVEHNEAAHPNGRQVNFCAFRMISLDERAKGN